MRIISRKALTDFWSVHRSSEQPLRAWYAEAARASWTTPAVIKARYSSASFLPNDRVVFNIKGNDFRLIVAIKYEWQTVYVRFVGTHVAYDKIDAATI